MQAVRHLRGPPSTSPPGPGLGAWPRERRASSPEQPGCSPVGERLGQSQFLYWALDGTDGRKFKGSQPVMFQQGGLPVLQRRWLPYGMHCQQQHPTREPLHGVPPLPLTCSIHPLSIPCCPVQSKGCPCSTKAEWPCQGLWPANIPLPLGHELLLLTKHKLTASGTQTPRSQSSTILSSNCIKKRGESSLGLTVLFHCEAAPWPSGSAGGRCQAPGTPSAVPLGSG